MAEDSLRPKDNSLAEPRSRTPLSKEFDKKLLEGDVNVGDGMMIGGEGEARKLRVILLPGDPDWQTYKDQVNSISTETRNSIRDRTHTLQGIRQSLDKNVENTALKVRLDLAEKGHDPYQGPTAEELAGKTQTIYQEYDSAIRQMEEAMNNSLLDMANLRKQHLTESIVSAKIGRMLDREQQIADQIRKTLQRDDWDDPSVVRERTNLYLQLNDVSNLSQYVMHMYYEKRAFEVTVAETPKESK